MTERLLQNFITQSSDADVFTGVDLERRNLLYKYRGFWTWLNCRIYREVETTRQLSISFVIEDHRRKIPKSGYLCMLIDCELYSIVTYSLSETKYADWLQSIFYRYLLTFGKLTRLQYDYWRMHSSNKIYLCGLNTHVDTYKRKMKSCDTVLRRIKRQYRTWLVIMVIADL